MDTKLLVDAIVRQTTVLIAHLCTAAGVRAPLAHVADRGQARARRAYGAERAGAGGLCEGESRQRRRGLVMGKLAALVSVGWCSILACAGGDHGSPQDGDGSPQDTAAERARAEAAGVAPEQGAERQVVSKGDAAGSVEGSNTNWRPGGEPGPGGSKPRLPSPSPPSPVDPEDPESARADPPSAEPGAADGSSAASPSSAPAQL